MGDWHGKYEVAKRLQQDICAILHILPMQRWNATFGCMKCFFRRTSAAFSVRSEESKRGRRQNGCVFVGEKNGILKEDGIVQDLKYRADVWQVLATCQSCDSRMQGISG